MAQARRKPGPGAAASDDGMKGLLDLFGRNPTPARVTMHVERLLAGWREALDPDGYAERLDTLRENLLEGIALTEESAGDIDPASKAETRQAAAVVASMRTASRRCRQAAWCPPSLAAAPGTSRGRRQGARVPGWRRRAGPPGPSRGRSGTVTGSRASAPECPRPGPGAVQAPPPSRRPAACGRGPGPGRRRPVPPAHAAQQFRQVLQPVGDDVDDLALALHPAVAGQHGGRQHQPTLGGVAVGPEHQVRHPRLVLDGDEHDALGRAGLLPHQHDAGHHHAPPVAQVEEVDAGRHAPRGAGRPAGTPPGAGAG